MNVNNVTNVDFGKKIRSIPNTKKLSGNKVSLPELNMSGLKAFIGCDVYMPTNKIVKHDLLFKDGKLVAIDDFDEENINEKIDYIYLNNKTVAPGIFDEHIHGGCGISFNDSNETEIRELLKELAKNGTSAVLATLLPGSAEHIKKQIQIINNIIKNPDKGSAKIIGIHLEGPFLNPEKKGIHSEKDLIIPTIENYKSLNPENVKMVTLAPELDEGYELTKYLREIGVIVSAGHSVASAKQIIESGIRHVTHLFNAMKPMHHRDETICNEGLLNDNITAEMLADEGTLSVRTMNMIMKMKPIGKLILISDALQNAGKKEDFMMNGKLIHVDKDMIPRGEDGTLAGNMKFLHNVAQQLIKDTTMTLRDFIRYASVNPSKCFGVADKFSIKSGAKPIFSIWDNKTNIPEKTFVQ